MIKDLCIKEIRAHSDHEGFFSELAKSGEKTFHEIKQVSYSETKSGVIKAFHLHKKYWESICVIKGQALVVVHDVRHKSRTKGQTECFLTGEKNMILISIPPGVAHGYRAIGEKQLGIIYCAGEAYNPKNTGIEEIPYNDSVINFDWDKYK